MDDDTPCGRMQSQPAKWVGAGLTFMQLFDRWGITTMRLCSLNIIYDALDPHAPRVPNLAWHLERFFDPVKYKWPPNNGFIEILLMPRPSGWR